LQEHVLSAADRPGPTLVADGGRGASGRTPAVFGSANRRSDRMEVHSNRGLSGYPFAILLASCWLLVCLQLVGMNWTTAARTLLDTDDALRLVEMRDFLAGQGWFDLHLARLGPPLGYDSHWSRLIDAGLAGLFSAFRLFVDTAQAELLMRVVWPLLWLLPAIAAAAAIAWRIGGRKAALLLLLLVAVDMPAFQQFRPGRIDHHNVQIALAMAAIAASAWSERVAAAALAGALTGLALAIGLEGLPFLVIAGGAIAVRFGLDRAAAVSLRAYGLSLAVATLSGFLVSVGPAQWGRTACDAMAINWMEPVVVAGLSLAIAAGLLHRAGTTVRFLAVATAAGLAGVMFVALEPRCLSGPYAMMDPTLRQVWFAHVHEMQSLRAILGREPAVAATILAFPIVTLMAIVMLARDAAMRRNPGFRVAAVAALAGFGLTITVAKMYSYAVWIGMPLVAALIPGLFSRLKLRSVGVRFVFVIMLTPAVLSVGAGAVVQSAGARADADSERKSRRCFDTKSYAELARLPKGLVASDVDYGPFILALTPHSVVGAPYHRLPEGVLAAHRIFALPSEEARRVIAAGKVDYLVTCGDAAMGGLTAEENARGLWGRLAAGDPPAWLEKLPDGGVFKVYRVK
jgi:hypothetical protein